MESLYQEQINEIDLYKNYKLLLEAIFSKKPKQVHSGITSTRQGKLEYGRTYWQLKGKEKRRLRRLGYE